MSSKIQTLLTSGVVELISGKKAPFPQRGHIEKTPELKA
jgi:hypothetical protein